MMSLIEPELRLPMAPISEQNMAKLRAVMEKYELI
jgi:hypothetical protein